ncbi:hypothetical protein GUJ93_ZPchr0015g6833 [Zizania palustris]|uniref:Uncharacterized protein n=1 Tax=Zizania palustris TaxID=103762 RepID=A0A8J5T8Y2_ZIZPA|nr:hypothetical protein GUJ93_ZPchr0015g6833 [Zizania palustris]
MLKRHGTKPGCFECGDLDHFISDFPKQNTHKKGTDGGSYDSSKHNSSDKNTFTEGKPKTKFFQKALKDYRHENKKWDKAFFTEMERSYSKRSSYCSSSLSSSDFEIVIKKEKEKDKNDSAGQCFMAFGDKPKAHTHHSQRSHKCVYLMALGDK